MVERPPMAEYTPSDLSTLPEGLPVPVDDGRAKHLTGLAVPSVPLPATTGERIDLSTIPGLAVVFAYPRTGRPGQPPLTPDWDLIPGARGCTPQTCAFRDLAADFGRHGIRIFGLSTQEPAYQRELADRLHLPFPVLSDAERALTDALRLPSLNVAGHVLLARLSWLQRNGRIERVWYPVFPPDRHASEVLAALVP
ncbi:MAG TPA: peroxiredoxin [Myxococcaceae bacterium]|nr:peroxiredoxin [Myxococcaceae bacterium]